MGTGSRPAGEPPLPLPGSPSAVAYGCSCSRLANASYRVGASSTPLFDPDCELHRTADADTAGKA